MDIWDFVFTWHIENFKMLVRRMMDFDSPVFKVQKLNLTQWFLQIRYCDVCNKDGRLPIYLCRVPTEGPEQDLMLGTSLAIVSKGEQFEQTVDSHHFKESSLRIWCEKLDVIESILTSSHEHTLSLRLTLWGCSKPDEIVFPGVVHFSETPIAEEIYDMIGYDGLPGITPIYPTRCSARTHVEVFRCSFSWTILPTGQTSETIGALVTVQSALRDAGSMMLSFTYKKTSMRKLHIEVCRIVPDFSKRTFVRCGVTILVWNGSLRPYAKDEHLFTGGVNDTWLLHGIGDPIMPNPLKNSWSKLSRNEITLQVELAVSHEGCEYHIGTSPAVDRTEPEDFALQDMYMNLHRLQRNCDVVLRTDGGAIRAHKCVLSARSPVFRAMLECDMLERNTGEIYFPDLDHDVLDKLVTFMYCARAPLTTETALRLYVEADKYDLPTLRDCCMWFLKSNLTEGTAIDALVVAELHDDADLMNWVTKFIITRAASVLHSTEWEALAIESPRYTQKFAIQVLSEKMKYMDLSP